MNRESAIFVAGHRGMVGSALVRALRAAGFQNLVLRDRSELDLTRQADVEQFFATVRPEYVLLAAARVGGILANDSFPANFLDENLAIALNLIGAAHKAGVRIAAGTDAGTPFNRHERFALELRYLNDTGLSKEESLVAATSRSAEVIGRDKAGRIVAGCYADLIFLSGDPTRDLDLVLKPKAVWVRGTPVA